MEKKKKIKGFEDIGTVLKKVLADFQKSADYGLIQVWNIWEMAVGPVIAENTRPAAFKGKILLVHVTSSVWTQELQFLKKDIIGKVNEKLGADLVEEIKFKIGPL